MTNAERAVQTWSVLAMAATYRHVLTYDMVGRLVRVPRYGLKNCLEPIQNYCLQAGLPALTSIVVGREGVPLEGFIAVKPEDLPKEMLKVFEWNWLEQSVPTVDALESVQK